MTDTIAAPDFRKDALPHNPYKCLQCSLALYKSYHRSHSDLSASNEYLAYSQYLSASGLCNSPSPVLRSRSHTSESMVSSSGSSNTTPKSQSSNQEGAKVTEEVGVAKPEHVVDDPRVKEAKEEEGSPNERKCRSPLVRMKRVISEGSEVGRTQTDSGSSYMTAGSTGGEPSSSTSSKMPGSSTSSSKGQSSSPSDGSGSSKLQTVLTAGSDKPSSKGQASPTGTSGDSKQASPSDSDGKAHSTPSTGRGRSSSTGTRKVSVETEEVVSVESMSESPESKQEVMINVIGAR